MARPSGRTSRAIAASLLLLLLCGTCRRDTAEDAYRAARADVDGNELGAALTKVDAALARFDNNSDQWVWSLRILRGEILIKRESTREGRAIVAPELPPNLRTSEAAVRRLIALGIADSDERRFAEAHALARLEQPQLLGDTHIALANVAPLDEAEAHLHTAIDLGRAQGSDVVGAIAYSALSRRYTYAGRYAEAIDAGEEALRTYDRLGVHGRVSGAAGNLGWSYTLIGDYETAEELFARAVKAAQDAGLENERMKWLNQLGNVKFDEGAFAEADRYYEQALALAAQSRETENLEAAQFSANRARAALALGHIDLADQLNTRALAIKRAAGNLESELISQIIEARIEAARGQTARAEQTLREVSGRTETYATRWEAQARLAQLYVNAGHRELADVEFRRAIETAGRARAEISPKGNDIRLPFFNLVAQIFDSYIDFLVDAGRIEDALAVTELSRAQSLEEGLGIASATSQLDARAIAKSRDATILCYWLGRGRAYLWVVTPASLTIHPLPAAKTIEAEIAKYRRDLAGVNGTLESSGARGRALYQMLVAPAGAIAKDARVIVVADGKLHELNFETLVANEHYWIEDVVLSSASSLQLLAHAAPKRVANESILLVGNVPAIDEHYPHLQHAWSEIAGIKKHFANYKVLNDRAATPAAYRDIDPGGFEYVHFVAHGVASRKRPLESAVILARDAKGYKLYARDIVKQPLHARLVTISSCHGAGTRTYAGEGLVGLAWAFLAAGSENVIGALWEVNDTATPKLMEQMYVALRAGRDPAIALRDAKLTLVRAKGIQRKPFYWAPFVLYSGS